MKKFFSLLAAIAAVSVLMTSCKGKSEKMPIQNTTMEVSVTTDTTIYKVEKTNRTAPRWSCDGKKQKYGKLLGVDSTVTPVTISQTKTETVEVDCQACLEANGVISGGNSGTSNSGSTGGGWDWSNFWKILAAIVGIALLLWFLWWLFNQRPERNKISSSSKTESMSNSAANPERIAMLHGIVTILKGADGKGKGMVKDNSSDGFEVVSGKPPATIRIKNTGSGNVYVVDHMVNSGNSTVTNPEPAKPATHGGS